MVVVDACTRSRLPQYGWVAPECRLTGRKLSEKEAGRRRGEEQVEREGKGEESLEQVRTSRSLAVYI